MHIKHLGLVDYLETYTAMQTLTAGRSPRTSDSAVSTDELWLCEHPPVFTQGLAGKPEHVLLAGDIPVIQTNRGGQITYHGPGQIVAYPLLDLKSAGYFVKEYVHKLEEATIRTLAYFGVTGHRVRGAPGIYVRINDPQSHARIGLPEGSSDAVLAAFFRAEGLGKIAALGIKVSRHFTLHGAALNVEMDLTPFSRINPCGYSGLQTIDLKTIGVNVSTLEVETIFARQLQTWLID
jgi:lipoyl(octanoyl) transferase